MNKQLVFLLVISAVIGVPQKIHADCAKNCMVAGGILAAIGGVATVANWFFSETDEQLINRAVKTYNNAFHTHTDVLHVFNTIHTNNAYDEQSLYTLATYFWNNNEKPYRYLRQITQHKNQLQKLLTQLDSRTAKMSYTKNIDYTMQKNLQSMREIASHIACFLPRLKSLIQYLSKHNTYFELYIVDGHMRNDYNALIKAVNRYKHNTHQLIQTITHFAIQESGTSYPLVRLAEELQADINHLKTIINKTNRHYHNRIASAKQVFDLLSYALSVLCADPSYAYEYNALQNEKIAAEKLRLQKEQNRLTQQRLQYEKERLQLERERLVSTQEYVAGCNNTASSNLRFEVTIT